LSKHIIAKIEIKVNLRRSFGALDRTIARKLALPLIHSGKSKLFQNFTALHDPAIRVAPPRIAESDRGE
jgi:hypothetical protein